MNNQLFSIHGYRETFRFVVLYVKVKSLQLIHHNQLSKDVFIINPNPNQQFFSIKNYN